MKRILYSISILFIVFVQSIAQTDSENLRKNLSTFSKATKWEIGKDFPQHILLNDSYSLKSDDFQSWAITNLNLDKNIKLLEQKKYEDELGFSHSNYKVHYKNYLIQGALIKTHSKNGLVKAINTDFNSLNDVSTVISISEEKALSIALAQIPSKKYAWQQVKNFNNIEETKYPKAELVILPIDNGSKSKNFRLTYKFDIYSLEPLQREFIYIDAASGQVLNKENRICHINGLDASGTATTKYSGVKSIATSFTGANYILREGSRGNGIETYNSAQGTNYSSAVDFTDLDNNWNNVNSAQDEVATDAHWGAEQTYDYYFTKFSRNSYDNNGAKIKSYVHYSYSYNNAFWDGSRMTYGDGDGSSFTPLVSVDVCGHEITHAVTEHTASLVYLNESGALNESFSDIFGKSIEFYSTTTAAGWAIGNKITPNGLGIRNMQNPNSMGDPDTYNGTNWYTGSGDNGGVHVNSGVQNHWFYLLCQGGTGTNDLGNAYSVEGIGIDKAARIAYRNLTVYLTPSATYADAKYYAIQAAEDLYGACSDEVIATANAWYAVGVGSSPSFEVKASFSSDKNYSCAAPATFSLINNSQNATNFVWKFSDGTTSTLQNPTKTFSVTGLYSVKLVASGSATCGTGADSLTKTNFLKVDNLGSPVSPTCQPTTISTNATYGITEFILNTIDSKSSTATEGYKDFTCSFSTNLSRGKAYTVQVTTNKLVAENAGVWIDYNNDGSFSSQEKVLTDTKLETHSSSFIVPGTAILNTPLRIRVGSSATNIPDACSNISNGQYEDYSVIISTVAGTVPSANFISDKSATGTNGIINFADFSENLPTIWNWSFPGGNPSSSSLKNPSVSYSILGTYGVSLTASNSYGSSTTVKNNFINVSNSFLMCSSINGTSGLSGTLFDSGGLLGGYQNYENCSFLIEPACAQSMILKFKSFNIENSYDYLKIYNGNTTSAPLLLNATGYTLPDSIIATSGKALIVFTSDNVVTSNGFELNFYATKTAAAPIANFSLSTTSPGLNTSIKFNNQSQNDVKSILWDFGNGKTSTDLNPTFVYTSPGVKLIKLRVSNCVGSDSIVKSLTVQQAAIASISPRVINSSLLAGDSTFSFITISNTGLGDLVFEANNKSFPYDSTSTRTYLTTAATTVHKFTTINSGTPNLNLQITLNGDYDYYSEYASLYVNDTYIEDIADGDVINGIDIVKNYTLGGSNLAAWLASGKLEIRLVNSADVNTGIGGNDQHTVNIKSSGGKDWISIVSVVSGIIVPNSRSNIYLKISAKDKPKGVYQSFITIKTSDINLSVVTILSNLTVAGNPIANFSSNKTVVQTGGQIQFYDASLNTATGWNWTFTGGNPLTSSQKNPLVTYSSLGNYPVKLSVSNAEGNSSITKLNYINVTNATNMCTSTSTSALSGKLFDSGGESGNYGNYEQCSFLISPPCAGKIKLTFQSYDINSSDYLYIFNGTTTNDPLIFYGNIGSLPYDVIANSGKMLVYFSSGGYTTRSGFEATWTSTLTSSGPVSNFSISNSSPIVGQAIYFTDNSTNNPSSWLWNFGNGNTSNLQNPSFVFTTAGVKNISLSTTNCISTTGITKAITVGVVSVSGISPNPTTWGNYVSIYGTGLSYVYSILYKSTYGYTNYLSFSNYGSYLSAYIPSDAVTGALTLTGSFAGQVVSPVLTITYATPTVTSINPNPTSPNSYVYIYGSGFGNVNYVYYKSSYGYNTTSYFNNYGSYLSAYIPSDAVTSTLTLTGAFGQVTTQVLTVAYASPNVTSINPNPTSPSNYISIYGSGFANVNYVYYKSSLGQNNALSFSNYGSYLSAYIPSDAVTGVLTLAGGFGKVTTQVLTVAVSTTSFMCMTNAVNSGSIAPTVSIQSVAVNAGAGYYWTFSGINNTKYRFSTCGASEDTYLRIYNSTGYNIASNDDSGPACSTTAASIDWICPSSDTYYVLFTKFSCGTLTYNSTFYYNTIPIITPTVAGINPNPTSYNSYVSITGAGFGSVDYVYYKSNYGYNNTLSFTKYGSYLYAYIPSDATTNALTLTGAFGQVATPVLTVTYISPTVTSINPNPTSPNSYVNINGSGFSNVDYVYYKSSNGYNNTLYFNNYGSYLSAYIPSDALTSVLTLSGGFGQVTTPVLTVVYISPTVTSINPNPTSPGNYINIYGSGFNNVDYVYYKSSFGYNTTSYFYNYGSYLSAYIPYDAVTSTLTLTGGFGKVVTPVLTVAFVTPTVTSINPNPTSPNSYVNIYGSGFNDVGYVYYKSSYGYITSTNFYNYGSYLYASIPSDAVTSTLTLTGGFGKVLSPVLTVAYATPTVTSINPNPTSPNSYVNIYGSGFNDVGYVYYKSSNGFNNSLYFNNYGSYLYAYIPSDALTGVLTLTGSFGKITTPLLTVAHITPTVTSISPDSTAPSSYVNIYGSGFSNVDYVYYKSTYGYNFGLSFSNYGSYLRAYIPNNALTGALTLTGGFGQVTTPILTVVYPKPIVTNINPNPTSPDNFIDIYGSNFSNVGTVYYKSSYGYAATLIFNNYGSFLDAYIPSDALTGVLTLSGAFGQMTTPVLYLSGPVSNFIANETMAGIGEIVQFSDLSLNSPTAWNWTFVGGNPYTSTEQNPRVTYATKGDFDVLLAVTNPIGNHFSSKLKYMEIYDASICPANTLTGAIGVLYDDGGITNKYSNDALCKYFINSSCNDGIDLKFTAFQTELNNDILYIYNNASKSQLLNFYSGSSIPNEIKYPNNNLYLEFKTNDSQVYDGFVANWKCSINTALEASGANPYTFEIFPNPSNDVFNIKFISQDQHNATLKVYNSIGILVIEQQVKSDLIKDATIHLSMADFPSGLYLVEIQSGEIKASGRLVLEK